MPSLTFSDWIIAHVHVMHWVGMVFNLRCIVLVNTTNLRYQTLLKETRRYTLLDRHDRYRSFVVPMYWAGFTQATMWKSFTDEGQLQYQFLKQ